MLPQFTYIASVLDPKSSTYDEINRIIGLFINTGTTKPITKTNWIHKDILYGPKNRVESRIFWLGRTWNIDKMWILKYWLKEIIVFMYMTKTNIAGAKYMIRANPHSWNLFIKFWKILKFSPDWDEPTDLPNERQNDMYW